MELKVWVEGIQRIVCGVTEDTTCQDVVYALAHATGRTGRFTLTKRLRNEERLLAPHEHPLKVLMEWKEHLNSVQFILQHSKSSQATPSLNIASPISSPNNLQTLSPERNKDVRKSLNFPLNHRTDNVGIVKGIPKRSSPEIKPDPTVSSPIAKSNENNIPSPGSQNFSYRKTPPSYRDPPGPNTPYRALPPYREPPPPVSGSKTSPKFTSTDTNFKTTPKRNLTKDHQNESGNNSLIYSSQYRDLVHLINYQRDQLSAQQAELSKYDAEIIYWETKTREQQHQMDILAKEVARVDATLKQVDEQLRSAGPVEEEMEIVKQQDRTLKSELTLLRSKLANCETELLLCKNKIRLLLDEIKMEQRILARESEERNHIEKSMLAEIERLQQQVEQAKHDAEMAAQIGDTLHKEVAVLEATINEKKRQVEKLVSDMKEANLQSLAISPPEELKMILEGAQFSKPGSTRKMIGSPRQLENAVPTSKNPHGVWV
ncbi:ras association domain-containing protein 8 isoform X2 [Planococcus citri]|uniref:ras association domain-containing protein 8 isoform X2 n=1 Tax=Planococcus citri TaxID=170843 RepID=UPI0031FA1D1A